MDFQQYLLVSCRRVTYEIAGARSPQIAEIFLNLNYSFEYPGMFLDFTEFY